MTGINFDENGMIVIPDTTPIETKSTGMQFDENGMFVIPAAQPAPSTEQPQGETSGASVSVSAGTEEGAGFLEEAYRAVVGGVRDGAQEIGETVQWAGEGIGNAITGGNDIYYTGNDGFEWLSQDEAMARDDIPEWQTRDLFGEEGTVSLPEVAENKTMVGGMARGVTQFVAGYGAVGKSLKLAKATTKTGAAVKGLAQGAATDFVAFDAHEDRLSDLVQSVPALQNPLTDWLEAEADDSILEGKLKNAVEGLGLGVAMEGVMHVFRAYKRAKPLANAGDEKAATEIMNEAAEQVDELQLDLFDATTDPNLKGGDQLGPRPAVEGNEVASSAGVGATRSAPQTPSAPVNTDALQRNLYSEMVMRRGGSFPDANRSPDGDLFNFNTWDSDVELKDVMNMATESIREAGTKEPTTFAEIVADSRKVVAGYVDVDPAVLDRSLARMAQDAEQQQAMVVAAKGLVQSLAGEVERLAYKIDSGNATDADMTKFLAMQSRMVETSANLKSVITGAAQTTTAGRIRTTDAITGQQLARSEIIRQQENAISDAGGADAIKQMARSVLDAKDMQGVSGVVKAAEGTTSAGKVLQEYWINSILSGPKTQIANITGNMLQTVALPTYKVAGGMARLDQKAVREGVQHYAGLSIAVRDATRMALKALKEGRNILDPEAAILEANGVNTHAIRSNIDNELVRNAINWMGTGIRIPSRLLSTGDEFFKQLNYRADLYAKLNVEAFDLIQSGKITKEQAGKWVADRMETGFNKDGSARHLESLNVARETTFTNELRQGSFSRNLQNMSNRHPWLKLIVPFVRTPTNIIVQFAQTTPGLQYASKTWREELAAGGSRAATARGKQVVGGLIWGSAIMAALDGRITGTGPKDPQQRARLMETGWRPYSFRVENDNGSATYIEYKRLDPFAMVFGIAADVAEIGSELDEMTMKDVALAATVGLMQNLASKSYLTGIQTAVKAMEDPARWGQSTVNSYGSSMIPFSSAMREARKQHDPYMREVRSLVDSLRNTVPGLSDDLPARRSWITGEPIAYPSGWGPSSLSALGEAVAASNPFITSNWKQDKVLDELAGLQYSFSAPTRKVQGIELDTAQYARLNELHGTLKIGGYTLHDRLGKLFESDRYERLPTDASDPTVDPRIRLVQKVITGYREKARAELLREYPEIRQQVRSQQQELSRNARRRLSGLEAYGDLANQ